MLDSLRARWATPQVRPDDFREAGGHVLMVLSFHDGDSDARSEELRQSWVADVNDERLINLVRTYDTPAAAARALEALAPKVPA